MTIGSYLYDGDGASSPGEAALRSVDRFSPGQPAAPAGGAAAVCAVAVVDADLTTRSRLAMQLGGSADPVPTLDVLAPRLTGTPLVLVVGPSTSADPRGVAAVERLVQAHPEVGAIMLVAELSTDVLQQALRSGVRDVLAAPVDTVQLHAAVQRVAIPLAPVSFPAAPMGAPDPGPDTLGRVVTVFSTKGGSGKTVMATNLAVSLARRATKPVVLVDADLQFGDVAVMLKLAPQRTIVDAVGSIDRLDAAFLQSLLVRHEPSGLLVLPAPLEPAFADQIGASDMSRLVGMLRTFCEYVVIDTPAYFNEVVLSVIEASDDLVLVAGLDIPNIKNMKIGLQTLRLLNTPMDKIRLVLNRSNSKVKLDAGEVERTLQIKADVMVPSDVVVPQSVNKGIPVVLDAPKSGVAKAISQMADLFSPPVEATKRRR